MLWICGTAALLALIWLYLIFPGKPFPEARAPFEKRAFAHRGLYEKDQSVPENSLPAFRRGVLLLLAEYRLRIAQSDRRFFVCFARLFWLKPRPDYGKIIWIKKLRGR